MIYIIYKRPPLDQQCSKKKLYPTRYYGKHRVPDKKYELLMFISLI